MKKVLFVIIMTTMLVLGVNAQAWAEKWQWPLVAVYQSYNIGDPKPVDSSVGNAYWPSTEKLNDSWKAAREGTLTIEEYYLFFGDRKKGK